MNFQTAVQICLTKYVDFTGRARRSEYWYFFLFNVLVSSIASVMDEALPGDMLANVTTLVFLMPSIGVAVRRMHDIGKSGWFVLIPIYNIVLLATDSDPAPNAYGTPVK